jgi:hypothetical protein
MPGFLNRCPAMEELRANCKFLKFHGPKLISCSVHVLASVVLPFCQNGRMNFNRSPDEVIATFGEARLVRYLDGKFELLGGKPEDRREAHEWCSSFMRG